MPRIILVCKLKYVKIIVKSVAHPPGLDPLTVHHPPLGAVALGTRAPRLYNLFHHISIQVPVRPPEDPPALGRGAEQPAPT